MTEVDARAIVGWRYDGPYAGYDCPPEEAAATVRLMLDPASRYFAIRDAIGDLVGYCCFGAEARVPGGDYADVSALDVGLSLRPDLTGRGLGAAFVAAIVWFARERLRSRHLRLTVAAWNRRAIRVYEQAGFCTVHTFTHDSPGGRANGSIEWLQMTRDDRPVRFVCTAGTFRPVTPARNPDAAAVRWLGPADYLLAAEAWRQRGGAVTRDEWETTWPADGYRFASILTDGRLVSVAAALSWKPPSPISWELAAVWTREDLRSHGLATVVCSFVTAHILQSGRRATCKTPRGRPAMIRVAERLGYVRTEA
jgi:RimJ/RimL family protein N-acetyltransferase